MKHTAYIAILWLIGFLFLNSCTQRHNPYTLLVQADSLMEEYPDSALHILQNIEPQQLNAQADQAYYALLLTQARDKNYIVQTNDSLIRIAVQYYNSIGDASMQAEAHYYWGCIWRDKGHHLKAIEKYHEAQVLGKKGKYTELSALLYSNIAYLYYIKDLNFEADSVYQLAEQLALQQKDTISLVFTLSQRGTINLEKGENFYSEAERQMQQALLIAEHFPDSTIRTPVYESLSKLYSRMGKAEKALQYAKLNYFSKEDTLHCYRAFLVLGDAYFKNKQYDSAKIYLQKVFAADRYYVTKADASMRLAEIAEMRGETAVAAEMQKKQSAYTDSTQQNSEMREILQNIISQDRESGENFREQYVLYYAIIVFLLSSVVATIVITYYIRRKQKRLFEKEQLRQSQQTEVDLPISKKEEPIEEEYESSAVYIKLKMIARTLVKAETSENLDEEEWRQLIIITNAKWDGIITYLNTSYRLSTEEIQICCLYLAGIPVKHIGHFVMRYARSTIQLKAKEIMQKMEAPQGRLLKDALFSLSQELKSNQ
ncbi:tetratricopeptide repeat protein [Bacteroides sp. UBA939]|uniref:tetratricopeptide repeat protein n=1 Tax=Bacteroides sp. UBA939 TaxID=1946092 RepID=UPI0025C732C7|nr:hypothetical protein [Bacteroides sp. UBA939]